MVRIDGLFLITKCCNLDITKQRNILSLGVGFVQTWHKQPDVDLG